MPNLPANPDEALNNNALDTFIKRVIGRDTSGALPPNEYTRLNVRESIGWAVTQFYGLDSRYGFNRWEDSLNVSIWSSFWHDGFSDFQKRGRIWELYLTRYTGDRLNPAPYVEVKLESTTKAALDGFGEGLKEGVDNTLSPIAKGFQFVGNNLVWIALAIIVVIFLPTILTHLAKTAEAGRKIKAR